MTLTIQQNISQTHHSKNIMHCQFLHPELSDNTYSRYVLPIFDLQKYLQSKTRSKTMHYCFTFIHVYINDSLKIVIKIYIYTLLFLFQFSLFWYGHALSFRPNCRPIVLLLLSLLLSPTNSGSEQGHQVN